jgi:hypothetical protein
MTKTKFINSDICKQCGGRCCKQAPGAYSPSDFSKPIIESLTKALVENKACIDWWEGSTPIYFVRAPTITHIGQIYDASWGGQCAFLKENGCQLPYKERPRGCRLLEPMPNSKCICHGSTKRQSCRTWHKYRNEIKEAAELARSLKGD